MERVRNRMQQLTETTIVYATISVLIVVAVCVVAATVVRNLLSGNDYA